MTYVANYTSDDIDDIVIDILGKIGVAVASLGIVVGFVLLYKWYKKSR